MKELSKLARGLDRDWSEVVGKRYDVVLLEAEGHKLFACRAVKVACGWSLMVTKRIVELAPVKVMKSVSLTRVESLRRDFRRWGPRDMAPPIAVFPAPCDKYSDNAIERADEVTDDFGSGDKKVKRPRR